jgi:quercetin dioxygenase-like cupin family protein
MPQHRIAVAVGFVVLFAAGLAAGQASVPTQSKGVSAVELRSIDLTDEIDSTAKRPLRLRKITVEPGGVLGLHTHKDHPAVNYFLQGSLTYHQEGKPDVVMSAGDGIAEGKATTHWAENRGTVPAVLIAVDIPK